jgi:hypothetical protein
MPTTDDEGLAALEKELRGPVPEGVRALKPAELGRLAAAVHLARRRQAAELAAAADRGLRFVPRVLRAPLRKVLG